MNNLNVLKASFVTGNPRGWRCQDAAQESPFPKFENVGGGCSESHSVILSVWVDFYASLILHHFKA